MHLQIDPSKAGMYALEIACRAGNLKIVECLVKTGAFAQHVINQNNSANVCLHLHALIGATRIDQRQIICQSIVHEQLKIELKLLISS